MLKHFGINHKSRISAIILLGAILMLLASASSVLATNVLFVKEHHPASSFTDGLIPPTDGYVPGASITFHLHLNVTSSGGGSAIIPITNLTMTDNLPAGLTYVTGSQVSAPAANSFSVVGQLLTWNWTNQVLNTAINPPNMPPTIFYQATVEFTVTVDSSVADATYLTNVGHAAYNEVNTGAFSNPTTTDSIFIARPVLDIIKTNPAKVENGTSFNETITLSNTGHLTATGVVVQDILPAGAIHVPGTSTASSGSFASDTATNVTWTGTIGNVTGPHTVTITIPVTANTPNGTNIVNTATYTAAPNGTQFTHTSGTCTTVVIHPALTLTKTPSATKVENNTSVTYTYTVTNTGDTSLTVNLTDNVFASPIFLNKVIPAGTSNVTTVSHLLTANTTNVATATGVDQTGKSVSKTATATVQVIHPAIKLTKTASPIGPQIAPATFTYTYNVSNIGDVSLSGIVVFDITLNTSITLGTTTLAPGQFTTGTLNHTYAAPGNYTNFANATGTDQTGAKANAFANATVVVIPPPSLATRTIGFWQTHTTFTEWVFDHKLGSIIRIDSNSTHAKVINTYGKLFGAFYASIPKNSDDSKRPAIDSARMRLLQQLVGAILNHAASGVVVPIDPVTGLDIITAGNLAYSSNNATEMGRVQGLLDTFNGSGDGIAFPAGLPDQGSATPQASQAIADIEFWDSPL